MTHPQKDTLLDAILPHVAFDGWSPEALAAAVADTGMTTEDARAICPRGAVDLAVAFHLRGDAMMVQAMQDTDMSAMRYRDKVAFAIRARLDAVDDKEAVRRGTTLFALPMYAADGTKLIWGTADAIWTALGDTSRDINWYTKRATLSGVYASCVLYWLGDDSMDGQATDAFINRRIGDVMQIETVKAQVNNSKILAPLLGPLHAVLGRIKAPDAKGPTNVPGQWLRD